MLGTCGNDTEHFQIQFIADLKKKKKEIEGGIKIQFSA